jgi:hypothetical protein
MKSNQLTIIVESIYSYTAMFLISLDAGCIRIQRKIIFLNVISKELWTGAFYGVLPCFCCYFSSNTAHSAPHRNYALLLFRNCFVLLNVLNVFDDS